jgi:hypothetical protein
MPRQSPLKKLPAELKSWLDHELVRRGFSDYTELAKALNEQGVETSKSGLHRYGSKLEKKLSAVRDSTEAARQIAEVAGDDADLRSEAVMSMIQSDTFNILVDIQDLTDEEMDKVDRLKLNAKVAKSIAELSRARVNQAKWKSVVMTRAQEAADKVAKLVTKGGMTKQTEEQIRRAILGIAT